MGGSVVAVGTLLVSAPAGQAATGCVTTGDTTVCTQTGEYQWTVPQDVTTATITVVGAGAGGGGGGGGGGTGDVGGGGGGGGAALIRCVEEVESGWVLKIEVGGGGQPGMTPADPDQARGEGGKGGHVAPYRDLDGVLRDRATDGHFGWRPAGADGNPRPGGGGGGGGEGGSSRVWSDHMNDDIEGRGGEGGGGGSTAGTDHHGGTGSAGANVGTGSDPYGRGGDGGSKGICESPVAGELTVGGDTGSIGGTTADHGAGGAAPKQMPAQCGKAGTGGRGGLLATTPGTAGTDGCIVIVTEK